MKPRRTPALTSVRAWWVAPADMKLPNGDGRAQGRAEALREAEAELIRMGYTEMDEAVKRIATLERTVKP